MTNAWAERLRQIGHTGWRDPFIYAYDQPERVHLVRSFLDRKDSDSQSVLDFGCGTGDFSRMLLHSGRQVFGYDPHVSPRIGHESFELLADLEAVRRCHVDAVISVTVLDHIIDDDTLARTVACLREALVAGGRLIMLEYALDAPDAGRFPPNDLQAFRTLRQWQEIMDAHGLRLTESWGAPHPIANPSPGFTCFHDHFLVRTLRLVRRAMKPPGTVLDRIARRCLVRHPPQLSTDPAVPLKLMVFTAD